MTPVRRRDLAVLALGLAVACWLLVRVSYGWLPSLDWWLPAPLALLALAEALGARTLRTRLTALRAARAAERRDDGDDSRPAGPVGPARYVEPMLVARLAVLAQASAYVGAVFLGVWLGVLAYVGPSVGVLEDASGDAVTALVGIAAAGALIAAALRLESACRVPPA